MSIFSNDFSTASAGAFSTFSIPDVSVVKTFVPDKVSWLRGPSLASENGSMFLIFWRPLFTASTGLFTASLIPAVNVSMILLPDVRNQLMLSVILVFIPLMPSVNFAFIAVSLPPVRLSKKVNPAV